MYAKNPKKKLFAAWDWQGYKKIPKKNNVLIVK